MYKDEVTGRHSAFNASYKNLKKKIPDSEIDVLIEENFKEALEGNPYISNLITFKREKGIKGSLEKFLAIKKIRRKKYSCVFNFHGNSTSYIFTFFSRADKKIGLSTHRFKRAYTDKIDVKKDTHSVLLQLSYLRAIGINWKNEDISTEIFIDRESEAKISKLLKNLNLMENNFILIHPNATLRTKKWPEKNFSLLNDMLISSGIKVLFVGAKFEHSVLEKIEMGSKKGVKFLTVDGIKELAALIKKTSLFICCDSGPMHIAAALKKRILVIWGSSNFNVWHPWDTNFVVIKRDLECSPCKGYRCIYSHPKCIDDIEPSEVFERIKELIEKS